MTPLIHKITQSDYIISFHEDFEGMVRIEFTKEYDSEFYEHFHVGFPGASMEQLGKDITIALSAVSSVPVGTAFSFNTATCAHSWKTYTGFTEKYDYCLICDQKRS
jgi:hypothetical protein